MEGMRFGFDYLSRYMSKQDRWILQKSSKNNCRRICIWTSFSWCFSL